MSQFVFEHKRSVEEWVGQLLWVGYEGVAPPEDLLEKIRLGLIGGVTLFSRNLPTTSEKLDLEALVELNQSFHGAAPVWAPLWISVDQEGGLVQRLREPATRWPAMMAVANHAPSIAFEVGLAIGREVSALGFDVDFAPICDIHTNNANPIIGNRAMGTDPDATAIRVGEFVRGIEQAGVVSCGKHFPGHGDTDQDSHIDLPSLPHDLNRLRQVEFVPFRAAIDAGVSTIMTAHVVFTALDPNRPATLCPEAIQLLRNELGFQGLIISDDLDMAAVAKHFPVEQAAIDAVSSGCDVLLLCRDLDHQNRVFNSLVKKASEDEIFFECIRTAATRILKQKLKPRSAPPSLEVVGCPAHLALRDRLTLR